MPKISIILSTKFYFFIKFRLELDDDALDQGYSTLQKYIDNEMIKQYESYYRFKETKSLLKELLNLANKFRGSALKQEDVEYIFLSKLLVDSLQFLSTHELILKNKET